MPILDRPQLVYEPVFSIEETIAPGIADKRIGQRINAIIDFEVIEKTKNYTALRINHIFLKPSRRRF